MGTRPRAAGAAEPHRESRAHLELAGRKTWSRCRCPPPAPLAPPPPPPTSSAAGVGKDSAETGEPRLKLRSKYLCFSCSRLTGRVGRRAAPGARPRGCRSAQPQPRRGWRRAGVQESAAAGATWARSVGGGGCSRAGPGPGPRRRGKARRRPRSPARAAARDRRPRRCGSGRIPAWTSCCASPGSRGMLARRGVRSEGTTRSHLPALGPAALSVPGAWPGRGGSGGTRVAPAAARPAFAPCARPCPRAGSRSLLNWGRGHCSRLPASPGQSARPQLLHPVGWEGDAAAKRGPGLGGRPVGAAMYLRGARPPRAPLGRPARRRARPARHTPGPASFTVCCSSMRRRTCLGFVSLLRKLRSRQMGPSINDNARPLLPREGITRGSRAKQQQRRKNGPKYVRVQSARAGAEEVVR